MELEEQSDRVQVRRQIHAFLIILLNSTNYGINFFDSNFGTSTR